MTWYSLRSFLENLGIFMSDTAEDMLPFWEQLLNGPYSEIAKDLIASKDVDY